MLKVKGFTIVELMITLAILGIILSMATPAMSDFLSRQRVSGQANELTLALALARSEAVKRGIDIAVLPATNAGTGWSDGWCVGPAAGPTVMSNCADPDLLRNFDAPRGVTISSNFLQSGGGLVLFFRRDGTCPNCGVRPFTVTSPQLNATNTDARCIDISLLGRVTVREVLRDTAC